MNTVLQHSVNSMINTLEREYRTTVLSALSVSDGTLQGFVDELHAARWDFPELPVEDIVAQLPECV